jgi:hypothetical protein
VACDLPQVQERVVGILKDIVDTKGSKSSTSSSSSGTSGASSGSTSGVKTDSGISMNTLIADKVAKAASLAQQQQGKEGPVTGPVVTIDEHGGLHQKVC